MLIRATAPVEALARNGYSWTRAARIARSCAVETFSIESPVGSHQRRAQRILAREHHAAAKLAVGGARDVVGARDLELGLQGKFALRDHKRRHELGDRGDRQLDVGVLLEIHLASILIDHVGHGA